MISRILFGLPRITNMSRSNHDIEHVELCSQKFLQLFSIKDRDRTLKLMLDQAVQTYSVHIL